MSLPATDGFTGTGAVSANWTQQSGDTVVRLSDRAACATGFGGIYWNADAFNAAQYSQANWFVGGGGSWMLTVRASGNGGTRSSYCLYRDGSENLYIAKYVNNSFATISGPVTDSGGSDGRLFRLEVSGTALTAYRVGVLLSGLSTTDSDLSSGAAGLVVFGNQADDWEGGDLSGPTPGGSGPLIAMARNRLVRPA